MESNEILEENKEEDSENLQKLEEEPKIEEEKKSEGIIMI